jgi:hypothetical protein
MTPSKSAIFDGHLVFGMPQTLVLVEIGEFGRDRWKKAELSSREPRPHLQVRKVLILPVLLESALCCFAIRAVPIRAASSSPQHAHGHGFTQTMPKAAATHNHNNRFALCRE